MTGETGELNYFQADYMLDLPPWLNLPSEAELKPGIECIIITYMISIQSIRQVKTHSQLRTSEDCPRMMHRHQKLSHPRSVSSSVPIVQPNR